MEGRLRLCRDIWWSTGLVGTGGVRYHRDRMPKTFFLMHLFSISRGSGEKEEDELPEVERVISKPPRERRLS